MGRLCKINILIYSRLVREFYKNLKRVSGGITSSLKGIEISLSNSTLGQILGILYEGIISKSLADRKGALRYILDREDVGGIGDLIANTLSMNLRLLHYIIGRIFLSKTERFDFISGWELVVTYHLIQSIHTNPPGMMLIQMREAAKRVKAYLPYGMLLTRAFEAFGVSLESESFKKL